MELSVGMYVRTKRGIAKVKSMYVEPNQYIVYTDKDITFEYYLNNKSEWVADYCDGYSFDITDLLQVGDYVNGYKVFEKDDYLWIERLDNHEIPHFTRLDYLDIKSIVTKEQFESMSYKVGE